METTQENPTPTPEKKKGVLSFIKDKMEDKETQFEYIGVLVRLLVVVWSGGIVTLNYIQIPGLTNGEKQDITIPASLLAGGLASFGLEKSGKKKDDGTYQVDKDKAAAQEGGTGTLPYHTIRIETPIKLVTADGVTVLDTTQPKPKA